MLKICHGKSFRHYECVSDSCDTKNFCQTLKSFSICLTVEVGYITAKETSPYVLVLFK